MQPDDAEVIQRALMSSASELTGDPTADGEETDLVERLGRVTRAALEHVPGADHVALTMRRDDGEVDSFAPTSPEIGTLDRLQVDYQEGPCLDVVHGESPDVIEVEDFGHATHRWPRFAPAAVEQGMGSLVAVPMVPDRGAPGVVNFYSRAIAGFDHVATIIARAFAMQAGVAVHGARRVAHLRRAVSTRDVIGQAKGILMQRHHVGADQAFRMLVGASQDTNMKLVDVARWLVEDIGTRPAPGAGHTV